MKKKLTIKLKIELIFRRFDPVLNTDFIGFSGVGSLHIAWVATKK